MSVDPPAGEGPPPLAQDEPTATARNLRVIVVDDEPLVARALARMLSAEHAVEVLASPKELARRAQAGERWDVVLCDLIMPEMTGMELARELQRVAPELASRMVFVTGGAYTDAARAFLDAPGCRSVEKPVEAAELRAIVRAVGSGRR